MWSDDKISKRDAAIHTAEWIRESLQGQRHGQFEALMADFANRCSDETLRTLEGEFELVGRLSRAYNILYALQSFGFPNALQKFRWSTEQPPSELRKAYDNANASIWQRRDPNRSFAEGFQSDHYFSGDPSELHSNLSEYMSMQWLRHPEVDWLFMDMMITREMSALGEVIKKQFLPGRKDQIGENVAYFAARGRLDNMMPTALQRLFGTGRAFNDPKSAFSLSMNTWQAMLQVWQCLAGPVINPTLLREEMVKAKALGAVWDGPSWALIDRVIDADRAVWLVGRYAH